ncbi:hypothetical protein ACWFRF_21360 [Nocardia sp. NPDC055165]
MATQGYYNHYDEPEDEYWEDGPRGIEIGHGSQIHAAVQFEAGEMVSAERKSAQSHSRVSVTIGADRLPSAISIHKQWLDYTDPTEYGRSVVDAYENTLYSADILALENGQRPSVMPKLRDITPRLLQARTYDEYIQIYNGFLGGHKYTAAGPGQTEFGEPSIIVTASASRLLDVRIDPGWASRLGVYAVAEDIVVCCNKIRDQSPKFVYDEYLSQETEDEVISRMIRHSQYLLRNEL